MQYIVQTRGLGFAYDPGVSILENISLEVPQGSVYGLLGGNGAGKTTLLQLAAGLLKAGEGQIELFGRAMPEGVPDIYLNVGALISEPQLYHHLSGYENLRVFAEYRDIPDGRVREVLRLTGLEEASARLVSAYSTGMKQRLGIALALLPDPELLILDEPTNGLDPQGIFDVRRLILQLNTEQHKTVVLSSHLLSEVEQVCSHLGILHQGKLVFQGTAGALAAQQQVQPFMRLSCADPVRAAQLISEQLLSVEQLPSGELRIALPERRTVNRVVDLLRASHIDLYAFSEEAPRLEDWYFEITRAC